MKATQKKVIHSLDEEPLEECLQRLLKGRMLFPPAVRLPAPLNQNLVGQRCRGFSRSPCGGGHLACGLRVEEKACCWLGSELLVGLVRANRKVW